MSGMQADAVEVAYAPNRAEIARASALAARPLWRGVWRGAALMQPLVLGLIFGLSVLPQLDYVAYRLFLSDGETLAMKICVCVLLVGLIYLLPARLMQRRVGGVLAARFAEGGARLRLDAQGMTLLRDGAAAVTPWRHVDAMVEARSMLLARNGLTGTPIPDRLLAAAGDPEALRARILDRPRAAQIDRTFA